MSEVDNNSNTRFVTEIFDDKNSAENAYHEAIKRGYQKDDINILMSDESRKKYYDSPLTETTTDVGNKATEGLGIGSLVGGTIGGAIGAIAAIGTSIIFPGLGIIVAGPLAAGLAGVGAGSLSGGLLGALVGWGIPEEKAAHYESGIKNGGIVLGVHESSGKPTIEADWQRYKKNL
jgi:hypothetical protein